jgi:hypothetical protein
MTSLVLDAGVLIALVAAARSQVGPTAVVTV